MRNKIAISQQRGFTMIELLISLVLGSLVVLAATVLLLSGQRSMRLQQGAAEIQNNTNFALNMMAQDIRMTNLDTSTASINKTTLGGGIVFSGDNIKVGGALDANLVTKANASTSNVNEQNDQLTIQYRPVKYGETDCEGVEITKDEVEKQTRVIQRYFVRKDENPNAEEKTDTALVLACDAGRVNSDGTIQGFSATEKGQVLIKRVDYFHVMLSTSNKDGNLLQDYKLEKYLENGTDRITGVKIGLLVRSTSTVGTSNIMKKNFQVFDKAITLSNPSTVEGDTAGNVKSLREVITQTIALRNALGDRE